MRHPFDALPHRPLVSTLVYVGELLCRCEPDEVHEETCPAADIGLVIRVAHALEDARRGRGAA